MITTPILWVSSKTLCAPSIKRMHTLLVNYKDKNITQSKTYRILFRDGQDTTKRDFDFHRIVEIEPTRSKLFVVDLRITTNDHTEIVVKQTRGRFRENDLFNTVFTECFPNPDVNATTKTLKVVIDSE